ncbi:MAG: helix-turn-helix domain-containing protein [Rickettsiales bacterium]
MRHQKKFNMILGNKIKALRKMEGLTQIELGMELGYSSSGTISQIEKGISGMDNDQIVRAARFFGVDPLVLFTDHDYTDKQLRLAMKFHKFLLDPDAPHFESIEALLDQAVK